MSGLGDFYFQREKMRNEAANAKPDEIRIGDAIGLKNAKAALMKMKSEPRQKLRERSHNAMQANWNSPGGGSRGDALLIGLEEGLDRRELAQDEAKIDKEMTGLEKLEAMVEHQNEKLAHFRKLDIARQSVTPRIMAYLKSYNSMSPSDRKVYLQNTLEEYNQAVGTNYKLLDTLGSEPHKVMVSDDGAAHELDLLDVTKTPQEQKLEFFLNSPGMQKAEQIYQQDHNLDVRNKQAMAGYHEAQAGKAIAEQSQHNDALKLEKDIFDKTGDRVINLDRVGESRAKWYGEQIRENTQIAQASYDLAHKAEKLKVFAEKNPQVFGNSLKYILMHKDKLDDPSFWNHAFRNAGVDEKDEQAFDEVLSVTKTLNLDTFKKMSGFGKLNMMLERMGVSANPNMRMNAKAAASVSGDIAQEAKKVGDEYAKSYKYYKDNYVFYQPGVVMSDSMSSNSGGQMQQGTITLKSPDGNILNVGGNVTPEKIKELEQQGYSRVK